jgi:conjugative relaxase-like TrwC/TraI family protein
MPRHQPAELLASTASASFENQRGITGRSAYSVSLLWALGDRETAEQVVVAHDAAVDAAVGYLQRAAGFTRRGAGGAETVPVDGFVAAAFRHRTSRADDPLLHTHVRRR